MRGEVMEYLLNKDIDGKEIPLKKLQKLLLDMLMDIDSICKKSHIQYMLFSGSILGAVRHKGFIPWDDDLDIAVTRKDYYKLIDALEKELPDQYTYQCFEKDKRYLVTWPAMKIRKKGTYIKEQNILLQNKCHDCDGVFVDVFILDYVSENKRKDYWNRFISQLLAFPIIFFENIHINPVFLKKIFLNHAISYGKKNKDSKYIGDDITWIYQNISKPYVYEKDKIFPTKRIEFEGKKLPVPKNPEHFLEQHYGKDYMTPPPESKRVPGHVTLLSLLDDGTNLKGVKKKYPKVVRTLLLISILLFIISLILFNDLSLKLCGIGIVLIGIVLLMILHEKE